MKSVVIKGQISTMSNKNDSKFKQEIPTKTAYLIVDAENAVKLQEFGLTLYTSNDGVDFFAVKTSKQISLYSSKEAGEEPAKLDMSTDTGVSIKTADNTEILMNIISGENMGNVFYRLQAIKVSDSEDIEEIKAANPFSMEEF